VLEALAERTGMLEELGIDALQNARKLRRRLRPALDSLPECVDQLR